jgi:predicted HAD superfamily phosphohydrolase YqeG
MSIKPPYWNQCRTALLIDLDNIMITSSGYVSSECAQAVLRRVIEAACASEWTIAVAPARTITHFAPLLAASGVRWQIVPCTPDAADGEIVRIAQELSTRGFRHFVVASSDGYFADIANLGRLTVISRAGQPVSRKLQLAAAQLVAA